MNSQTIVSDSDAFEASFRNWFWSNDKKDPDAADVIEDALAKDLAADEKVGDEAPVVDVALPNDVIAYNDQTENDVDKSAFLFTETIYIEGEVMDSPVDVPAPPPSDHEEGEASTDDKNDDHDSDSEDEKSVRSITDIIETSLTSGRELRRSYVRYHYSSDEDDFLKTTSSSDSRDSESDQDVRSVKGRGRGRPAKAMTNSRVPNSRRCPQDKQTEEELVQQIAQETSKRFVCRSCFKSFAYKKCLRNHYEAQHPDWLNGPDEDDLLRRVAVTRRRKHQSSDEDIVKDQTPQKLLYETQPMKASGHDYQSPVRRGAPFVKDDPVSESKVSVPTNEPDLPEPNAATYSIVVTVKGPPSFIKTYSKTKVLTDSIEKILQSPASSPKNIIIVPSSSSPQVSSDCLAKRAAEVKKLPELPSDEAINCNGNEDDDMEDISEDYSLENYDDVEIIFPSEEIVDHPEEIVDLPEEIIDHPEEIVCINEELYRPEAVVTDDMTSLIVDNVLEDIPYVCNEIVIETEEECVAVAHSPLDNKEDAPIPDKNNSLDNCDADDVPKRQPVVCLERLGNDIVEQFATRLRPRTGTILNNRVVQKEKLGGSSSEPQRKLRCNICGWRFKHSYHLSVHLLNHAKTTQFECLACRVKFFSKRSYDCHLPKCAALVTSSEIPVIESENPPMHEENIVDSGQKECLTATEPLVSEPPVSEPPQKVKEEEMAVSEELPIEMDTSEPDVTDRRVTRQSLIRTQQDSSDTENKKELRSNQKTLDHKVNTMNRKKRKIEEGAMSSSEDDSKSVTCNGRESLKTAGNLDTEVSQSSEAASDESSGIVRKSKRRGASSGAGFYFLMHHGQFQRNVCFPSPQANVTKKRKINGMHSPSKENEELTNKPVVQEERTEQTGQTEQTVWEEPAPITENVKSELYSMDTSVTEGDIDSEITLRLEELDDVEVDKMETSPYPAKPEQTLVEGKSSEVELTENECENVICNDEMKPEHVPINTEIETPVPSCNTDATSSAVCLTDVTNDVELVDSSVPNVENKGLIVPAVVDEDEKSRPSSTVSTEASLKMSESTEMSVSNSNLPSPSCVNLDKSDELKTGEEIYTHTSNLGLLGLKTEKIDIPLINFESVSTKTDVQLTGPIESVKSDEILSSSFGTDDNQELHLASDTDEVNESTKSEASLGLSSNNSPTTAQTTEIEPSPTSSMRRKVEAGYYSWLNGEQFSRRKSWSSSEASGGSAGQVRNETKKKILVCKSCKREFDFLSNLKRHQERKQCRDRGFDVSEKRIKHKSNVETSTSQQAKYRNKHVGNTKQRMRLEAKVKFALKNPQISKTEKKKYMEFLSRDIPLSSTNSVGRELQKGKKLHKEAKASKYADSKKSTRDVSVSREVRNLETSLIRDKRVAENKSPTFRKKSEVKLSSPKKTPSPGASSSKSLKMSRSVDQDIKLTKDRTILVAKSSKVKFANDSKPSNKKEEVTSSKHNKLLKVKSDKANKHGLHSHQKRHPLAAGKGRTGTDPTLQAKPDGIKGKELTRIRSTSQQLNDHSGSRKKISDNLKSYSKKAKALKVLSVDDDLAKDCKQGYQCKFCDHEFKHYFSWRYHIAMDHGSQTVCCPLCQKWQHLQNDALEQHLQTHFRREQFDNKAIVQRLVLLLIERKPMPKLEELGIHFCQWCNSAFGSRSTLEKHQRHEAVNKPHQCPLCGRRFADILQLEPHIISHAQTDSYRCKWCGKLFSDVKSLEFHEEHHTNNYKCDLCQKNFKSLGYLRRHQAKGCGSQAPSVSRGATHDLNNLPRSSDDPNDPPAAAVPTRTSNLFDVFGEAWSALRSQSRAQDELVQNKNTLDKKLNSTNTTVAKGKLSSSVVKKHCVNELAASGKKSALT